MIVDDHPLAREGVRAIFARCEDLDVVGEAGGGEEALSRLRELEPDLVLLDIRLGPGIDGLAVADAIRSLRPDTKVLMLTLHDAPEYVRAALAVGAAGYVLKDAAADELINAARQVLNGQSALPLALMSQALSPTARPAENDDGRLARLSTRERQVLDLVANGMTNKAIARKLDVSPGTIKTHVERIIAKLAVADRTQAAVLAARAMRKEG
jgi:DNA-binding NarL/FixJ family response regulator